MELPGEDGDVLPARYVYQTAPTAAAKDAGETIGRFQLVHERHDRIDELAETVLARFEPVMGFALIGPVGSGRELAATFILGHMARCGYQQYG